MYPDEPSAVGAPTKASRFVFSQEYETLTQALYIERKLKSLKRKDYIEKIIKDGKIKITPP